MGMILTLTTLAFLLMVQVACYHAISAPIGTSSEIILKSGEQGTLHCGFKGRAQAVSWTYQGSSSKQVILIKFDMLQQIRQRRVSGYGEGRYNISEDFSLIIHDVTEEDEGRYTCEVLESRSCSLLSNHTFVSVSGMHSEVVLKSGEDGTLTCDIKGEAHVVYWTYHGASSKQVLLVRLELLQHQVGQRSVALYEDGRYNVTDDFSLIIRDVTLADEGRYTCEILELRGSIVRKHSDVSVPEVKTVPNVLLESGKKAKLTCGYKRTVYAVYWRYESTTSPNMELLVVLDGYYQVGERSGPGYDEGRFDIDDHYSLVIHNVEAHNEGRYTCEVSDLKTGLVLRNHTDVHTIVIAKRPFVRIGQCEDDVFADEINAPCVLHATSDVPSIELTCTVLGAKPLVELTWISSKSYNMSEYWKQVMNRSTFTEKARGDGIFDQTLTVYVGTSFFTSDIQHFTCVAEGLAVDGKASFTISVYLAQVGVSVRATVISVVCIILFTFVMGVLWNVNLRDKWRSRNAALERKINKIKDMEDDEPVYLGLIGDRGAGKSSFIASLMYLIQGTDMSTRQHSTEWKEADNSSEIWRCTEFISGGLRIRKMRDEKTFQREDISTILMSFEEDHPSASHGTDIESNDRIHYPIVVFDVRNYNDRDNRIELLNDLSNAVCSHIGEYPMLLLTKATATTRKKELKKLMQKISIPPDNILVTFHFLDPDVKFDNQRRGEQLDFILKCVARVEKQKKERKILRRRTWWERKSGYMPPQSNDMPMVIDGENC